MLMFVLSEKGLNRFELVLNIFFKFVFKYYISDFVLHTFALDIHILVYTHRCPFTVYVVFCIYERLSIHIVSFNFKQRYNQCFKFFRAIAGLEDQIL